jgi:predicted ferric reductase
MRFHKGMAILAVCLLVAHPLLLAVDHGWGLFSFDVPWSINLGKVTLALLLLVVFFALFFKKLGIEYQVWRYAHKGAPVVIVLGFIHSYSIGPELRPVGMQIYWWILLGAVALVFLYRNAYVPLWGRRSFRVVSVDQETHDTYTVAMEPEDGESFSHRPGQFMFLRLYRPGRRGEEHPFTISSSPTTELPLTATIKESGDFTNTIGQTRKGYTAGVEAPYGRFSFLHHDPESLLFIAGGVGITPVLSMLRYLRDTGDERPICLIYGNKSEEDIIRREELESMPGNVQVHHVLSHPGDDWEGARGYVTRDAIENFAADFLPGADVYLCGPPPMMDMVVEALRGLNVEEERMHFERFAL